MSRFGCASHAVYSIIRILINMKQRTVRHICAVLLLVATICCSYRFGLNAGSEKSSGLAGRAHDIALRSSQHARSGNEGSSVNKGLFRKIDDISSLDPDRLKDLIHDIIGTEESSLRWELLGRLCRNLNRDNWKMVEEAFRQDTIKTGRTRPWEYETLVSSLGENLGQDAMEFWLTTKDNDWSTSKVMESWAGSKPDDALNFVASHPDLSDSVKNALMKGLARSDPRRAFELALTSKDSQNALASVANSAIQGVGVDETVACLNSILATEEGSNAEKHSIDSCVNAIAEAVFTMSEKSEDPSMACNWISALNKDSPVSEKIIAKGSYSYGVAKPEEAITWWLSVIPPNQKNNPEAPGMRALYEGIMKNPGYMSDWISKNPGHECYQGFLGRYIVDSRAGDSYGKSEYIAQLTDQKVKDYVASELSKKQAKK